MKGKMSREVEMSTEMSVDLGAMLLDDVDPKWYTKIHIPELNMDNAYLCICGQVFMDQFNEAVNDSVKYFSPFHWAQLNVLPESNDSAEAAAKYGFEVGIYFDESGNSITEKVYEYLAICWIEKIEKHLAEDGMMA